MAITLPLLSILTSVTLMHCGDVPKLATLLPDAASRMIEALRKLSATNRLSPLSNTMPLTLQKSTLALVRPEKMLVPQPLLVPAKAEMMPVDTVTLRILLPMEM